MQILQEAKMSKCKSIVILTILGILIAFMSFACFATDVPVGIRNYKGIFGVIGKGIDLNGGYYAVLEPEKADVTNEELDAAIDTLRKRLDDKGYTEATITKEDKNLRVEIPEVDNAEEVMELIGDQGKLTFRDYTNAVLVDGKTAIKDAKAGYDENGNPIVVLEFTTEGQKAFALATEKVAGYEDNRLCGKHGKAGVAGSFLPSTRYAIKNYTV